LLQLTGHAMLCNWNLSSPTLIPCLYRAHTGDFELFLNKLGNSNNIYKPKLEFIICGDINTDYFTESCYIQCLDSLLSESYISSLLLHMYSDLLQYCQFVIFL
jgi:hypothetical protein